MCPRIKPLKNITFCSMLPNMFILGYIIYGSHPDSKDGIKNIFIMKIRIGSDMTGNNWTRSILFIQPNFLSNLYILFFCKLFILKVFTHLREQVARIKDEIPVCYSPRCTGFSILPHLLISVYTYFPLNHLRAACRF